MSNDRSNNNSSGFVGGLLVGTAIGAIVGLLTSPRTGRETRQILKKSAAALPDLAEDLSSNLQLQAGRLSDAALQQWEATLQRLQSAVEAGVAASQDVQRAAISQLPVEPRPELYPYPPPTEPQAFEHLPTNPSAVEPQSPHLRPESIRPESN